MWPRSGTSKRPFEEKSGSSVGKSSSSKRVKLSDPAEMRGIIEYLVDDNKKLKAQLEESERKCDSMKDVAAQEILQLQSANIELQQQLQETNELLQKAQDVYLNYAKSKQQEHEQLLQQQFQEADEQLQSFYTCIENTKRELHGIHASERIVWEQEKEKLHDRHASERTVWEQEKEKLQNQHTDLQREHDIMKGLLVDAYREQNQYQQSNAVPTLMPGIQTQVNSSMPSITTNPSAFYAKNRLSSGLSLLETVSKNLDDKIRYQKSL